MKVASCPWDENIVTKIGVKRNTYVALSHELKAMNENKKCTIIEIVIGVTGTIHPSMIDALEKIVTEKKDALYLLTLCQKAVLLRTARICRQILCGGL